MREQVRAMRGRGLRDVRFITPTSLSYGSPGTAPNLDAVDALLAACRPLPGTPWRNEPPGRIPDGARRALAELTTSGRVYGSWERQEKVAGELAAARSPGAGHRGGRPRALRRRDGQERSVSPADASERRLPGG